MTHLSTKKERQGRLCHYCGSESGSTNDHIVPRVLGGPYSVWNLQPACRSCNSEKTDQWPTCDCDKCQNAIARFLQNPVWADKARRILKTRRDIVLSNIETVRTVKLPRLMEASNRAEEELLNLEFLILTHREDSDSV